MYSSCVDIKFQDHIRQRCYYSTFLTKSISLTTTNSDQPKTAEDISLLKRGRLSGWVNSLRPNWIIGNQLTCTLKLLVLVTLQLVVQRTKDLYLCVNSDQPNAITVGFWDNQVTSTCITQIQMDPAEKAGVEQGWMMKPYCRRVEIIKFHQQSSDLSGEPFSTPTL